MKVLHLCDAKQIATNCNCRVNQSAPQVERTARFSRVGATENSFQIRCAAVIGLSRRHAMRWPMAFNAQLCLQSVGLACAAEWQPAFPGWCLFQVTAGQGYWLAKPGARQMSTGDLAVLSP